MQRTKRAHRHTNLHVTHNRYTQSNTRHAVTVDIWTGDCGSTRKRGGRETCGREIKVEQTAAQIEGNGLLKKGNRRKKQTEKEMSER